VGFVLLTALVGFPNQAATSQERTEAQIFSDLEAFLFEGAVKNFPRIKDINDLCAWIARYQEKYMSEGSAAFLNPIDQLLRREFGEIDEQKLEILFHLILQCGGLGYGERILWRTDSALRDDPELFFRVLGNGPDWTSLLNKISENWSSPAIWETALDGAAKLADNNLKDSVQGYIRCLHEDRIQREKDVEAFMLDPVAGFERIKKIENLCYWIGLYEQRLIHDHLLNESALSVLFREHFQEVDEKRTEIIIHMVLHCGSGIYGEFLADRAEKMFRARPDLFVGIFERTPRWKDAVRNLFYLTDIRFESLGNSEFERKIKEYVNKLRH
jgi:hypothetical protein